jgi:hypothetical protein
VPYPAWALAGHRREPWRRAGTLFVNADCVRHFQLFITKYTIKYKLIMLRDINIRSHDRGSSRQTSDSCKAKCPPLLVPLHPIHSSKSHPDMDLLAKLKC